MHVFFLKSSPNSGCNEVCMGGKNGCSHDCVQSPRGPLCICPIDQKLQPDSKTCRPLPLVPPNAGTWKVVLAVSGALGLILVAIIVVVTLKYRKTTVSVKSQNCNYYHL